MDHYDLCSELLWLKATVDLTARDCDGVSSDQDSGRSLVAREHLGLSQGDTGELVLPTNLKAKIC